MTSTEPGRQERVHQVDADGADVAAPFDMLLTDAALNPLRRLLPGASGLRFAGHLARRPDRVLRRGRDLAVELARIGAGRSEVEPHPKDRRFADPGWSGNPLFHRAVQAYLAAGTALHGLVDDAELDWDDDQRMAFVMENLVDATAPSNNPLTNPAVLKAVIDTGGRNFLEGTRRLVRDLSTAPRVPSMVEPDAFTVGEDLAVTPGEVVARTDMYELIQYTPTTPEVRTTPLLVVPPTINKFYVMDLAPGRSLVEHLVSSGQQVFVISWRNPRAEHADWGLDAYGAAIVEAMDATQRIAETAEVALLGICSGGILASMVLGHLAAVGDLARVAALGLCVTVLDQSRAGTTSALITENVAAAATRRSSEKGYLDGRSLAEVFAWLRPNDLIWNYWVNNYLLGKAPKPFDILYWNADPVRMSAAMHRDFIGLALSNGLTQPGGAEIMGSSIDLGKVDVDSYVLAGIADHLCAWESCYRSTQLLGGQSRFVLSTSGHIASMVNPPGNPKASFQTSDTSPSDTAEWLASAHKVQGSWWDDYASWLADRSGPMRPAAEALGSADFPPCGPAPGTYVCES
ncbi:MAG: poly[(R)-3-hydroxyalkanoate] polymerase subunit PhaC [Nocardioidaceae bacterium]|nr:poly[(R)-3-hydroxyalkanoate] polymerase subunit PhaC [Nocardioidaceae bacterium]